MLVALSENVAVKPDAVVGVSETEDSTRVHLRGGSSVYVYRSYNEVLEILNGPA
jgi:hypothetical protein